MFVCNLQYFAIERNPDLNASSIRKLKFSNWKSNSRFLKFDLKIQTILQDLKIFPPMDLDVQTILFRYFDKRLSKDERAKKG